MTRHDDERTRVHFHANVRDVTAAAVSRAVKVLYVPFIDDAEVSRHCASVLSDSELQRAQRFVAGHEQARFTQRRAFRRFCGARALGSSTLLSPLDFEETANGRPYLPALPATWFSFSACRSGFLGAWSSTHAIGVDLEDRTRDLEAVEIARRFFTRAEARAIEAASGAARLHTFLQFWGLKEAALKSIGEGLSFGLDAFAFALVPELCVVHAPWQYGGPGQFNAHLIEGIGGCAALVVRTRG